MHTNRSTQEEAWSEALNERTIELRKRWLSFTSEDELLVEEVDGLIAANLDPLISDMYEHFLSFAEMRKFFPDEAILHRAQAAQKSYFARLCKGNYDSNYVIERLSVGDTHYRIGLDPTWYLGAYNRVLTWCRRLVSERYRDDHDKYLLVMGALTRLVFFDMGLAIEAYSIAKERAIRNQRDAIAELETQRRVTKNILEDAPLGIIGLDARLQCTECNHVFLEINGSKDRSEVLGNSVVDILPHVDSAIFGDVLRKGQPARATAALLNLTKHASPAVTFFDWAVWPVKDQAGNVSSLVATFADATDRVALQQQREDFVATLTHDLKTPILAANRAIKLLIEGDFGPVAESQKQVMETIHESNDAMYKMVQTLLDVYRYDSGVKRLSLGACDLAAMIAGILTELQPLANSRGVKLENHLLPSYSPVTCDHGELRRVIQNLLDNAMKFTPGGGTITVSMEQKGTQTQVAVADTGKGISDDDKPKLFQRFWAAASSGRYYASTGLGLYLCRKIVELHGGRIWVESALGKGSIFYFTVNTEHTGDNLAQTSDSCAP